MPYRSSIPLETATTSGFTFFTSRSQFGLRDAVSCASEPNAKWVCSVCGYVYDGETPFEELPDDWKCPVCKQPKAVFEKK